MDERTILDEVGERLELRGITPEQVAADPLAYMEFCQTVSDVVDDLLVNRFIYGSNSNGGQFTGFLASQPAPEIDITHGGGQITPDQAGEAMNRLWRKKSIRPESGQPEPGGSA